jgi:hypothetical protein
MSRIERAVLAALLAMFGIGSARADAIRSSAGTPTLGVDVSSPELARSAPNIPSSLNLSESMLGPNWRKGFQVSLPFSDLASPSLTDQSANSVAAGSLVCPQLPQGPLLGSSSEKIAAKRPTDETDIASNPETGHNIRIPEPASLTLVVAGVIGLFARQRMRRSRGL